ncbi:MAG: ketoacyl-ACP synthase III [Flavobacterium sp.]|nr:ketoacyl-ACP synthase III [Flavobacterium sp.]
MNIKITGSGSYIPTNEISNSFFSNHVFLNDDGSLLNQSNEVIIQKFKSITGINERRYVDDNLLTSDIATFAAKEAITSSHTDLETIDYIIFAHNFGNVKKDAIQSDILPSLASRVKHNLKIRNQKCVAYDILFGCPGWVEGIIQATAFIKAGMAKKCLIIGAETLSRVVDLHDRDSMIYSDGAGAIILEATNESGGVLAHETASFTFDEAHHLFFGNSFNKELDVNVRYIKMYGRKIYEFALLNVPNAMKICLDKSDIKITQIKKILIHQANEKMDEAIISRFFKLYGLEVPNGIMPMSIHSLGNSSVATIPTLFDLLIKGKIENHSIEKGDIIMFASVGAGMNVNAIVYQM